jgi:DNA-directed RNA polymerase subunit RPC12/RpoP
MQQPHNFDPATLPPSMQRRCPRCGAPMLVSSTEPTEDVDQEARIFECLSCAHAVTVKVKFR